MEPGPGVSAELDKYEQEQFEDWLNIGVEAGWVSAPDCVTHQGIPMRDWEEYAVDLGRDPCVVMTRIWRDGYQHLTMADIVEAEGE